MLSRVSSLRPALAVATLAAALLALPVAAAQARVVVGVGIGLPFFAPAYPVYPYYPPVVYPPPAYYPPPPGYYAPPAVYSQPYAPAASAPRCVAGAYACPLSQQALVGAPCSCPTNAGRIAGQVR